MKLIISGTRTFIDFAFFCKKMDRLTANLKEVTVIHGGAIGVDAMAGQWAWLRRHPCIIYHADWTKHGKAAGAIRNTEMLEDSGARTLVAFWDGQSKGTKDIIDKARRKGFKVRVIRV